MAVLHPDQFLSSVQVIDLDELDAMGVKSFLIDLDNTLLPRGTYTLPDDIRAWIETARCRGFGFCILSNNWHRSALDIAAQLELPIVWKAMKPCPFAFWHALRKAGFKRRSSIVVGDQLFTDVLGAKLGGFRSIMVRPLVEYDLPHTLFLRRFERFFIDGLEPLR